MRQPQFLVEVDPEQVRRAIENGRRERSEAVWALLRRAFGRGSAARADGTAGAVVPAGAQAMHL
jgi:hypothetical protein